MLPFHFFTNIAVQWLFSAAHSEGSRQKLLFVWSLVYSEGGRQKLLFVWSLVYSEGGGQKLLFVWSLVYSEGGRQKLLLAVALINHQSVILLDGPTTSMDPLAKRRVWLLMANYRNHRYTIMLSTNW